MVSILGYTLFFRPPPYVSYQLAVTAADNDIIHILSIITRMYLQYVRDILWCARGYADWRTWFGKAHSPAPSPEKRLWNITYFPKHFSIPFGMQTMLRDRTRIMRRVRIFNIYILCAHTHSHTYTHTPTQSHTRSIGEYESSKTHVEPFRSNCIGIIEKRSCVYTYIYLLQQSSLSPAEKPNEWDRIGKKNIPCVLYRAFTYIVFYVYMINRWRDVFAKNNIQTARWRRWPVNHNK